MREWGEEQTDWPPPGIAWLGRGQRSMPACLCLASRLSSGSLACGHGFAKSFCVPTKSKIGSLAQYGSLFDGELCVLGHGIVWGESSLACDHVVMHNAGYPTLLNSRQLGNSRTKINAPTANHPMLSVLQLSTPVDREAIYHIVCEAYSSIKPIHS